MSSKSIRIVFVLSVIVAVVMITTQYLWIKRANQLADNDFDRRVKNALQNVGENLIRSNHKDYMGNTKLVERYSADYYIVKVGSSIDPESLEELLKRELKDQDVSTDFQYVVYDCETDLMKPGKHVCMNSSKEEIIQNVQFPKLRDINYYFGVNFPDKKTYLSGQLKYLKFSTGFLICLLILLGYIIFIIFKQRRLQEIQKDFVNNMTHEFKTPLSTIQIASEVLKNPSIVNNPTRLLNYATIIGNETTHLTHQVERVLQMASTEKGEVILKKSTFDICEMTFELLNKYKAIIDSRDGKIHFESSHDNIIIFADKLHIKNLMGNLIDNAIKYCDKNPEIFISIKQIKNEKLEISIKDNGIGIPQESIKNIFNKFYRVPTGNIHNVKGFGLGLSYVKLIVKRHGGEINCTSNLGIGTEFVIFIPIKK